MDGTVKKGPGRQHHGSRPETITCSGLDPDHSVLLYKKAFDKGFPRQAKLIWLQTLKLYDPDNEEAHKALANA